MKKRTFIRNLDEGFIKLYDGRVIVIGVEISDNNKNTVFNIGFQSLENGESILPKVIGRFTEYNALGKKIPLKHLPKETIYYQKYWEWKQYDGYNSTKMVGKFVDYPKKRYQIEITPPPSIELIIVEHQGKKFVCCQNIAVNQQNYTTIVLQINLFLEIFEGYNIFLDDMSIPDLSIRKVNWSILPMGSGSWDDYEEQIGDIISVLSPQNQKVAWHRIDVFKKYNPDFIAIGNGGFRGYLVFAFPSRSLFILESLYEGNATYGLGQDWETISKLTKSEILTNELHLFRYIHLQDWDRKIRNLFR